MEAAWKLFERINTFATEHNARRQPEMSERNAQQQNMCKKRNRTKNRSIL